MTVLTDAQSYVGVLATFVVLCLFSIRGNGSSDEEKNPNEDSLNGTKDDDSNFIYSLIRQVGADSLRVLKKRINELKEPFVSCYERIVSGGKTRLDSVIERAEKEHNNKNFAQLLMRENARTMSAINDFTNKANKRLTEFDKKQRMGLKDELTFVALMNLIYIVFILFIDTLNFVPLEWRSVLMILLVSCSTPFLHYLYVRFVRIKDNRKTKKDKEWGKLTICLWAGTPFLLWLILALFVSEPILSICVLPIVMGAFYFNADHLANQMEMGPEFSRDFILRQSVYILFLSIAISTGIIVCFHYSFLYDWFLSIIGNQCMGNLQAAKALLFSSDVARYFVVIYFTLNVFILPLVLGYYHVHKMTNELEEELKAMFKQSAEVMKDANAAFEKIIVDMDSAVDF